MVEMRWFLASLGIAMSAASFAGTVTPVTLPGNDYVGARSLDNSVWLVRSRNALGGVGFMRQNGFQPLLMPAGGGAMEAITMSSNGQWVAGNATFEVSDYLVTLPVIWNAQGQPRVLTQDFTFAGAVGISDDGNTVLISAIGGGGGIWKNGQGIRGIASTVISMDRTGSMVTTLRDTGTSLSFGSYEVGSESYTQLDPWRPNSGAISGNGQFAFVQDAAGSSYRLSRQGNTFGGGSLLDVPNGVSVGGLNMVSDNGALAGSESGIWQEGVGFRSLSAILGPGYDTARVNAVFTDGSGFAFEVGDRDYLYSYGAVPEPASLAVLGLGALLMRRRRR
jgi:hypothetical protein